MNMIDDIKRELNMPNVRPTKERMRALFEYVEAMENYLFHPAYSIESRVNELKTVQAVRKKLGLA